MFISNITGKRVLGRVAEEKILAAWSENKSAKISIRDYVNAGDAGKLKNFIHSGIRILPLKIWRLER